MSTKPRVLLTGEIDWAQDEWNALSDVATLEVCIYLTDLLLIRQVADSKDREEFIRDLEGKYNGIYAMYRTFGSAEVFVVVKTLNEDDWPN